MAGQARDILIEYGSFTTQDAGVYLHGAHSLSLGERRAELQFDVVLISDTMDDLVATIEAQLNERHKATRVTVAGDVLYYWVDGVDTVPAGAEGAEFIQASWRLLGTHRSSKSRAYRITITVTRAAKQPGKIGVYSQTISTTVNPRGIRALNFAARFTPGPDDTDTGSAEDRFADGTYGFDALVTAVQTLLTGEWEQAGNLSKTYDEDARTLRAQCSYRELIYAQSAAATNDPALVGASYDIRVERRSAYTIPGRFSVAPLTPVTVLFSSGVHVGESQDLNDVINTKIVPYCRSTVAAALAVRGGASSLIFLGHGLRADPVDNRVAGTLMFLAPEYSTLEVSKRISDSGVVGEVRVPVLDKTPWTRDIHTGPGSWQRRVVIAVRVVGLNAAAVLDSIEDEERRKAERAGFRFVGWGVNTSPSVEVFPTGNGQLVTTVQLRSLLFDRADVRIVTGANGEQRQVAQAGRVSLGADELYIRGHGPRSPGS